MCLAPECTCAGMTCCGGCGEGGCICVCGPDGMRRWAHLSVDRRYRYSLSRVWDEALPTLAIIGLNPSTADETEDDPTIRRCLGFARSFGCGGLRMLNLFAWRSTDPKGLRLAVDPVGPQNMDTLQAAARDGSVIVAAWGTHGTYLQQDQRVRRIMGSRLHHLGLTKGGHPKHPLYLRADTPLTLWL